MAEAKRWQGLDTWEALANESYWQEFTRLSHDTKAKLLSQMSYSVAVKQQMVDIASASGSYTGAIDKVLAERSATAAYEQDMRYNAYLMQSDAWLNAVSSEVMLAEKLLSKQIAEGIKS
jgi:hypothetical protein